MSDTVMKDVAKLQLRGLAEGGRKTRAEALEMKVYSRLNVEEVIEQCQCCIRRSNRRVFPGIPALGRLEA